MSISPNWGVKFHLIYLEIAQEKNPIESSICNEDDLLSYFYMSKSEIPGFIQDYFIRNKKNLSTDVFIKYIHVICNLGKKVPGEIEVEIFKKKELRDEYLITLKKLDKGTNK